jgi:adenylate kinase family enzyme
MVIGKPRIGRTTLTKALATQLDLVRISTDIWIEKLLFEI